MSGKYNSILVGEDSKQVVQKLHRSVSGLRQVPDQALNVRLINQFIIGIGIQSVHALFTILRRCSTASISRHQRLTFGRIHRVSSFFRQVLLALSKLFVAEGERRREERRGRKDIKIRS